MTVAVGTEAVWAARAEVDWDRGIFIGGPTLRFELEDGGELRVRVPWNVFEQLQEDLTEDDEGWIG